MLNEKGKNLGQAIISTQFNIDSVLYRKEPIRGLLTTGNESQSPHHFVTHFKGNKSQIKEVYTKKKGKILTVDLKNHTNQNPIWVSWSTLAIFTCATKTTQPSQICQTRLEMIRTLKSFIVWHHVQSKHTLHKIHRKKEVTYTILVEDGKTDSARWVDIWVKEARRELALWGLAWVVLTKMQCQRVKSSFPFCLHKTIINMIHLKHLFITRYASINKHFVGGNNSYIH